MCRGVWRAGMPGKPSIPKVEIVGALCKLCTQVYRSQ